MPQDLSKDIKIRLQSINGQIQGLIKRLDEDTNPEKILIQFKAAQKGLDMAHFLLLDETYRKALAIKISEIVDACIEGEAVKDKTFTSKKEFSSRETAEREFMGSVEKLFNVNVWSKLPGVTSRFQLYDSHGKEKNTDKPQLNDFIKIILPGPVPENWVIVTDIKEEDNMAEFTVSPSRNPTEKGDDHGQIAHFFIDDATSTFRVELRDRIIHAWEIGKNEGINNQKGKEAGQRKFVNTLIAEGGWAGFQAFQWHKLTDYLVHKTEIKDN